MIYRGILLIAVAVVLGACDTEPEPDPPAVHHLLAGTIDARGDCIDASEGYDVTIRDGAGNVIATTDSEPFDLASNDGCDSVLFTVSVPEVPFYSLQIEGLPGQATYSQEDLSASAWRVELST